MSMKRFIDRYKNVTKPGYVRYVPRFAPCTIHLFQEYISTVRTHGLRHFLRVYVKKYVQYISYNFFVLLILMLRINRFISGYRKKSDITKQGLFSGCGMISIPSNSKNVFTFIGIQLFGETLFIIHNVNMQFLRHTAILVYLR